MFRSLLALAQVPLRLHPASLLPAMAQVAEGSPYCAVDRTVPLGKKVAHLGVFLHGVNHKFVATVEHEHHRLQKASLRVKPEPQLPGWAVLIEILDPHRPGRGLDRVFCADPVLRAEP